MANVLTVAAVSRMLEQRLIRYKVALTGSYVQAVRGANTGEVLVLSGATGKWDSEQYWGLTGPNASSARVVNPPAGYGAKIIPGADVQHWLLQLFSSAGTELVAGAYPAGILADVDIYVEFLGANYR